MAPDPPLPGSPSSPPAPAPEPAPATDQDHLAAYLRDRDALCPLCHYNLRNLTRSTCPECGRELRLSIALADPVQGPWVALMVGTCLGAGIGVLEIIALLVAQTWPYMAPALAQLLILYFLLCVPGAIVALAARRPFLRLPGGTQRAVAGAVISLTALAFLIILIWVGGGLR